MQQHSKEKVHLSQDERATIATLWKNGKWMSCREIARQLERNPSVISREIQRNWKDRGWGNWRYDAKEAKETVRKRRKAANKKHLKLLKDKKMLAILKWYLEAKHQSWWIDEIVGFLRRNWVKMVATSTVYYFIHHHYPKREHFLRKWKHWYRKRNPWAKKTALCWVPLIEERPEEINNREELGHWEADMVVWPKGEKWGLLTIVERVSRLCIIIKLERATKETVSKALIKALKTCYVRSITSDNWSEFAGLAEVGRLLKCPVYRCHPYSSREKGSNERNNGIIRRYCPKGQSIQQYSEGYIANVQREINEKPRKCLNYKNAHQVYLEQLSKVASS